MINKSTDDFVSSAMAVHGGRYDYSRVNYINNKTPVIVGCKIHGWFEQTPNNHLRSNGCSRCRYELNASRDRNSSETFIGSARKIHGDTYDYSLVNYVSAHSKVTIGCKLHGWFEQTPNSHAGKGRGCPKCAPKSISDALKLSTPEFIEKSRQIHNDTYDYTDTVYTDSRTPVSIRCINHGCFIQNPRDHLSGCGCPSCSSSGFTVHRQGFLYILESSDYVKIGITHNMKNRISKLKSATPFSFKLIRWFASDGETVRFLEKQIHKMLNSANLKGFDGSSEWFMKVNNVEDLIVNEYQTIHHR